MFRMVEKEPSFEPHTMFTIHPVLGALKVRSPPPHAREQDLDVLSSLYRFLWSS